MAGCCMESTSVAANELTGSWFIWGEAPFGFKRLKEFIAESWWSRRWSRFLSPSAADSIISCPHYLPLVSVDDKNRASRSWWRRSSLKDATNRPPSSLFSLFTVGDQAGCRRWPSALTPDVPAGRGVSSGVHVGSVGAGEAEGSPHAAGSWRRRSGLQPGCGGTQKPAAGWSSLHLIFTC